MNSSLRDVRNCPRCGKIFMKVARNLCPECVREEEALIDKVRDYLHDHRGATLFEVVEKTGAPEELVLRLIREGRVLVSETGIKVQCERCGRAISEGRFCNACKKELATGLGIPKQAPPSQPQPTSQNSRGYHVDTRKNPRAND